EYLLVYQAGIPADGKAYTLDVKVSPAAGTEAIAKSEISVRLDRPRLRMLLFRPAGTAQEADFTEFAAGQEIKGVLSFRPSLDRADLATRVEYYVNDQLRSTQTEQPFQFTWDTAVEGLREPKEFALKVKVYDAQGVASEQVWPARVLVPAKTLLQRILEVPVAILAILIGIGVLVLVWALYVLRARRLAAYPSGAWQRSSPLSSGGIGPSTTGAPPLPDQSTGWLSEGTTDPKGYPTVGTRETTVGMGGVNTVAVGQGYAGDRGEVSVAGAWLVMEGLPRPGYRYDLRADVVTLGRSTDCDIVVDDPAVSRQHARIQRQGTQFYLMDMGATNPTKVNGSPAGRVRLMDGDRFEVGRTVLIFKSAL
ncbi:MAG: FHA domain-containing protein, partial [Anaerolineae bacterium]|nr:FHA domain-containing protein [Anaerolineae bacterium]